MTLAVSFLERSRVQVSVDDFPVDLQDQPCIGMAGENDPPVTLRRYSVNTPDVARTVASKAIASMRNRTDGESNAFFQFTKIAKAQYDPTTENRCCTAVVRRTGGHGPSPCCVCAL